LPFVLEKSSQVGGEAIFVLAFGELSRLEAVLVLSSSLGRTRYLCERALLLDLKGPSTGYLRKLGGIHKEAYPVTELPPVDVDETVSKLLRNALGRRNQVSNYSVSMYCGDSSRDDYEEVSGAITNGLRALGFQKLRLLRPDSLELTAEEVLSREALDFVLVSSAPKSYLGVTSYVSAERHSNRASSGETSADSPLSMSPRLAKVLVNITGLSAGQRLLDPFCGSGTILAEGMRQGLFAIGVERGPNRIRECEANLNLLHRKQEIPPQAKFELHRGDARRLSEILKEPVDAIVTEPILLPKLRERPTLKEAKGMVRQASQAYSESLEAIAKVLKTGGRLVIIAPLVQALGGGEVRLELEGMEELGFTELQPSGHRFSYPIRPSFESTRWVRRAVYAYVKV
jgi:tRNA G10  N-methylase Trm11